MRKLLKGKNVAISGGAGGIGKKIVLALANQGANIILITHNIKTAKELMVELDAIGVKSDYISCEISDENQVKNMIEKIISDFGTLDIAINNAGFGPQNKEAYPYYPVANITEKSWEDYLNNCLKGIFFSMKYEIKQMQTQNFGVIINTAFEGLDAKENSSLYYIAKSGIVAMTKSAALENKNLKMNTIVLDLSVEENTIKINKLVEEIIYLCTFKKNILSGKVIEIN